MLTDFLRSLAPQDMEGLPLYAEMSSDIPDGLFPPNCIGITARFCDLALQSHLEAAGRWQGRGPALLVDNYYASDLAAQASELRDEPLSPEEFGNLRATAAVSIALHGLRTS